MDYSADFSISTRPVTHSGHHNPIVHATTCDDALFGLPFSRMSPDLPGGPVLYQKDVSVAARRRPDTQRRFCGPYPYPYPSPPSTGSERKRNVPLPCVNARRFGGSLDSPLLDEHEASGSHTLPSPPSALPALTLSLPAVEPLSFYDHDASEVWPPSRRHESVQRSTQLLPSPHSSSRSIPSDHDPGAAPLPRLDDQPQLLSPISPEWPAKGMLSPHSVNTSMLLRDPDPSMEPQQQREGVQDHADAVQDLTLSTVDELMLPPLDMPGLEYPSDGKTWPSPSSSSSSGPSTPQTDPMELDELPLLPLISPPESPFAKILDSDMVLDDVDVESERCHDGSRVEQHHLFDMPGSPEPRYVDLWQQPYDLQSSPPSPSLRAFASLPELTMDDGDGPSPPNASSPTTSPSYSPSSYFPTPNKGLISLPGADTDDKLLPADLALPNYVEPECDAIPDAVVDTSQRSLLLIDDEPADGDDGPAPRSPSPDPFTRGLDDETALLNACPAQYPRETVRKLCAMRRRAQEAERAARRIEMFAMEQGAVKRRWDAKARRKNERERSREISAILRLKIAERDDAEGGFFGSRSEDEEAMKSARSDSNGKPKKKNGIASMEQLVAKMMFRRSDTSRSLGNRKAPPPWLPPRPYARSPLSRVLYVAGQPVEDDDDGEDSDDRMSEDEDEYEVDSEFYDDWSSSSVEYDELGYVVTK